MKSMAQHKGPNGPGSVNNSELNNINPPKGTGFESDYERVERDEQCDDWNGFPKPCA
jgi:hypothetical protein